MTDQFDKGIFVISLDFELYWGVRDVFSIQEYYENLDGTRAAITAILRLFEKYSVHATWATVGLLFFENLDELKSNFPEVLPGYTDKSLCPYNFINSGAIDSENARFFFARDMIEKIKSCKNQEIASHCFSHFYTCEPGQTKEAFAADLKAFMNLASRLGIDIRSIVLPRNQVNPDYLPLLNKFGIIAFRGNERNIFYPSVEFSNLGFIRRAFRLLDSMVSFSGPNCYFPSELKMNGLVDVAASCFLRPHSHWVVDWLQVRRIKESLRNAAKHKKVYHLWLHPHSFGKNLSQNIEKLEEILSEFDLLKRKSGMLSASMAEIASLLLGHS